MDIVETDWWTLDLPEEWEVEQDGDTIVVTDADGVSCIELTTVMHEGGDVSADDLAGFAAELCARGVRGQAASVSEWNGTLYVHDEDDLHWREWFLARGPQALLVSYHCLREHAGMDDAAVDDILDSLTPLE